MGHDENASQRQAAAEAEHPFVVFSVIARNAEMSAAGHTFEGCFAEQASPEMSRAEEAAFVKQFVREQRVRERERCERAEHSVGCGHDNRPRGMHTFR